MNKDKDKIVKIIDKDGDGHITKEEVKDFIEKVNDKLITLVCPMHGNQHVIKKEELDNFYRIMGADDSWRV